MGLKFAIALPLVAAAVLTLGASVSNAQDNVSCANVPYEAAIPFCTRAIQSGRYGGRDLAGIYLNRGLRYAVMRDKERAFDDYTKALEIDPEFAKAYNNRGSLYFEQYKDYDKALDDYNEAIELDPTYVNSFVGRAEVLSAKGDYEGALEDFKEALRLNPQNGLAYFDRGITYIRMKDFAKAIADENQAIRLAPKAWQPVWARGAAQFADGKLDLAIADFNAALQINSKSAAALYARGIAKIRKGDTAGGETDIAAAKAIEPEIAEDWLRRMRILPDGTIAEPDKPRPAAMSQQSVPHAESCNNDSWGFLAFHAYEFGTVNSCQEEITIWFRKNKGALKKETVKGRGVFTTGYDMETYAKNIIPWTSATCPAGYEPFPRFSTKNKKAFDDSTYKCVATR